MDSKDKDSKKVKSKKKEKIDEKKEDKEKKSEKQIEIKVLTPELIKEPLATLSERIIAGIIDSLIVNSMLLTSFLLPAILRIIHYFIGLPVLLLLARIGWAILVPIAVLGMFSYLIFVPATKGKTIGQKRMGLIPMIIVDDQTADLRTFELTDLWLIAKRVLIGSVDILPFTIPGLILINNHPLNQALCDRLTNVVVIAEIDEEEEKERKQSKEKPKKNDEEELEDELVILK